MSLISQTTQSVLDYNLNRDPERLQLKLQALRSDAFAFFRGTAPLFYATLAMPASLLATPKVLACGDLHLENFSSYKGDNRLVYFDLSDFDEACIAPCAFDLARLLSSILLAAKTLGVSKKQATKLMSRFVDVYAINLAAAKPRWVERASAIGPVKQLLQSVKNHHRSDLIARRTTQKKSITKLITDGIHALKADADARHRAESVLFAYAATRPSPAHFEPIDIARRIAGNGSLGLERYVALVRGDGSADGRYLIDIKVANPSALALSIQATQPDWRSEAERVVSLQYTLQAIPPALLGSIGIGERSYVIKELQPTADRVNRQDLKAKSDQLEDFIQTMAEVTAWAHLRGAARFGADNVDALSTFAMDTAWKDALLAHAQLSANLVVQQWQAYVIDFDNGDVPNQLPNKLRRVKARKVESRKVEARKAKRSE